MINAIDDLIGAPPEHLERLYRSAEPADIGALGPAPRTRLLCVALSHWIHQLTRPLVTRYARIEALQVDKRLSAGVGIGNDRIVGRVCYRFRIETQASTLDARPTLRLSYAEPADRNHWPVPAMYDELRTIGEGVVLGPTLVRGVQRPLFWFGMDAHQRWT